MTLATEALTCAKQLLRATADGTAIADLEDEIKESLQETIRYYNRKPYALTEVRAIELTTAASTTWYSSVDLTGAGGDQDFTGRTAVDTKDILGIKYARENPGASGLNEPLGRLSYTDFERMFEGSTPGGTPTYWTYYGGEIGIWPTPDDAYTLYFSATVKPVVPTSDDDTSVWFDEAGEMIRAGACKRVCLNYLRDTERAAMFAGTEESERQGLEMEYLLKSSSGKIKAHC